MQHVDPDFLSPLLLHYGDDTPYIPVNLDDHLLPFLLDTGAAVSVFPKAKLVPLLTKPLSSYAIAETEDDRCITAFGGHLVSVSGPYLFPFSVLTRKLMHKLYVIDSPAIYCRFRLGGCRRTHNRRCRTNSLHEESDNQLLRLCIAVAHRVSTHGRSRHCLVGPRR